MSIFDTPEERLAKARAYRDSTGFTLPELWRHENPGKHELTIYGQTSADGWMCKGCGWQDSNSRMSEKDARKAHDRSLGRPAHQHDDWMIREAPSGDKYCAACGEVVEYKYPEHEKLKKVSERSQAIGEFLDWLGSEKGARPMHYVDEPYDEVCTGNLFYGCAEGKHVTMEGRTTSRDCLVCGGTGKVTVRNVGWRELPGSTTDLLAEFFEIDQKKIEAEKRQMLDEIRALNERESA